MSSSVDSVVLNLPFLIVVLAGRSLSLDAAARLEEEHGCPPRNTTTQVLAVLSLTSIASQLSNPASAVSGQAPQQHDRQPGALC
jgi:hypothetical protein